jgi:hypothetical protein
MLKIAKIIANDPGVKRRLMFPAAPCETLFTATPFRPDNPAAPTGNHVAAERTAISICQTTYFHGQTLRHGMDIRCLSPG